MIFGFVFVFICNQSRCEYTQWKNCDSWQDYLFDYWNMNDMVYLIGNSVVMMINLYMREFEVKDSEQLLFI